MPGFRNAAKKINTILSVIKKGEKVRAKDIAERLRRMGYKVNEASINMFIYHYMLHKYLKKVKIGGKNYYMLIN